MKTLPILMSLTIFTGCEMASASKEPDISGAYVADYSTGFSHVQDTIYLEATAKAGNYIFRSGGLITGQLDGKALAPEHPKTKPVSATFDPAASTLVVGPQGELYHYDGGRQLLSRGEAKYKRISK